MRVDPWKALRRRLLAIAGASRPVRPEVPLDVLSGDLRLETVDGPRWFAWSDEPLRQDDTVIGIRSRGRDITPRKAIEVALEEVRRRHADLAPTLAQLWPEHFDLAFSMAEINFGGSPGDAAHDEPYLYVGPWTPMDGPAWNEPWGMSLPASAVTGWSDAVDFFETGLRAALAGAAA